MLLSQLLDTIASSNIQVTLLESNEKEMIKFYTGGQELLTDDVLAREVAVLKISNQTAITVELKPVRTSI